MDINKLLEDPEVRWAFYHVNRSRYANIARSEEYENEVMLGVYSANGTTRGEFAMRWYAQDGDATTPQLEIDVYAWEVFNLISPILMPKLLEYDGEKIMPEQFCELLLELGFEDQTMEP